MSMHPFKADAIRYTWDAGKPTAHKGIAITTTNNKYPRVFLRTRADAARLATQIIDLIEDTNTWQ